jgi:hypothetical protein
MGKERLMLQSKNSRVGREVEGKDTSVLGKHNPGNVGATWKSKGRYSKTGHGRLEWRIRRKIAKHTYIYTAG